AHSSTLPLHYALPVLGSLDVRLRRAVAIKDLRNGLDLRTLSSQFAVFVHVRSYFGLSQQGIDFNQSARQLLQPTAHGNFHGNERSEEHTSELQSRENL